MSGEGSMRLAIAWGLGENHLLTYTVLSLGGEILADGYFPLPKRREDLNHYLNTVAAELRRVIEENGVAEIIVEDLNGLDNVKAEIDGPLSVTTSAWRRKMELTKQLAQPLLLELGKLAPTQLVSPRKENYTRCASCGGALTRLTPHGLEDAGIALTYYSPEQFAKLKQLDENPPEGVEAPQFENYAEWLRSHYEFVDDFVAEGVKITEVDVDVDELLKFQREREDLKDQSLSQAAAVYAGVQASNRRRIIGEYSTVNVHRHIHPVQLDEDTRMLADDVEEALRVTEDPAEALIPLLLHESPSLLASMAARLRTLNSEETFQLSKRLHEKERLEWELVEDAVYGVFHAARRRGFIIRKEEGEEYVKKTFGWCGVYVHGYDINIYPFKHRTIAQVDVSFNMGLFKSLPIRDEDALFKFILDNLDGVPFSVLGVEGLFDINSELILTVKFPYGMWNLALWLIEESAEYVRQRVGLLRRAVERSWIDYTFELALQRKRGRSVLA